MSHGFWERLAAAMVGSRVMRILQVVVRTCVRAIGGDPSVHSVFRAPVPVRVRSTGSILPGSDLRR